MRSTILLAALLSACSAERPVPNLCTLAKLPLGWAGSSVRVSGYVIGEPMHGYVIADRNCARAIRLEIYDEALNFRLNDYEARGLVILDASGKFVSRDRKTERGTMVPEGALRVERVHSIKISPMSEQATNAFWNEMLKRYHAQIRPN